MQAKIEIVSKFIPKRAPIFTLQCTPWNATEPNIFPFSAIILQRSLIFCKALLTIFMLLLCHNKTSDKGKPGESRRRKAMGLPSRK
jgi:hypothetical protein